jgi:hypothetical protein
VDPAGRAAEQAGYRLSKDVVVIARLKEGGLRPRLRSPVRRAVRRALEARPARARAGILKNVSRETLTKLGSNGGTKFDAILGSTVGTKFSKSKGASMDACVDLEGLAEVIRREHELAGRAVRSALAHAVAAGEYLLEAKRRIGHGGWLRWVREQCGVSERSAQGYMRLALRLPKAQRVADLPVREALKLVSDGAPRTELDRAHGLGNQIKAAETELRIASRVLDNPNASLDEVRWVVDVADRLQSELLSLQAECGRGAGRCLQQLAQMTGLAEAALQDMLADGSLLRACEERIAELSACS